MVKYYTEAAVDAVADVYTSSLQAQLTQAELDAGLTAGALPMPTIVKEWLPGDNRNPLLQVFEQTLRPANEGENPAGQRNRFWEVKVDIVLSYAGDAQLEANAIRMRRYAKALLEVPRLNPTLSQANGTVQAVISGMRAWREQDDSSTRYHYLVELLVQNRGP